MNAYEFESRVNAGRYSSRLQGAWLEARSAAEEECSKRLHEDLEALGGVSELPASIRTKLMELARKLTPVNPMGMRAYFHHLGSNYKQLAELTLLTYDAGRCKGVREDK